MQLKQNEDALNIYERNKQGLCQTHEQTVIDFGYEFISTLWVTLC